MKFRMNFGIVKTIVMAIVIAGALALAAIDIAMLAGAKGLMTSMPAVAGVSLAAAIVIACAAAVVLVNSYYKFGKSELVFVLGIFKDKIPYENIVAVKEDSRTKDIYIISKGQRVQDGETSLRITVYPKKADDVLTAIRESMPNMIIEVFTSEDKNSKKK